MDPNTSIIAPALILLFIGVVILGIGLKKREKSNLIAGIICLALSSIIVFGFGPAASEQSSKRHQAMENNILLKYNALYGNPIYLIDAKYDGPVGKGNGNYFNLTYSDNSTTRIKFVFSTKTGEPKSYCSVGQSASKCDMKHPSDLDKSSKN